MEILMNRSIPSLINEMKLVRVPHKAYLLAVSRVFNATIAAAKGELIIFVGPSRVGKSRAVVEACQLIYPVGEKTIHGKMPVVFVEAENASKHGEFSTKAFIVECLRAIKHPIYGTAAEDDPYEIKLCALHHRTPERVLREAFEIALPLLGTQILIIDEAQHVGYVTGGDDAAAKVLNSWKCIANKTGVVIVLSGSYPLLETVSLAPHVVGRQRPISFPRYRTDRLEGVLAWEEILMTLSALVPLEFEDQSLCQWNKLLMTDSLGCIGHLARWLRATMGDMLAYGELFMTEKALMRSRLPSGQLSLVAKEIVDGERFLEEFIEDLEAMEGHDESDGSEPPKSNRKSKNSKRPKPFQRKARRNAQNGRA
jgi:hypothetical protein